LVVASVAAASLIVGGVRGDLLATPGEPVPSGVAAAQNVDWMSAESARSLDLGFSVLVPSSIPAPFSSGPSISASGGYYSLYWGPSGRTFAQVTGVVGGSLPAGSPADLNNELSINASVRGYDAINDITAISDALWWIEGGVLYKVETKETSVTSIDLANSLVTLVPPEPEPEPTEEPTEAPEETPEPEETPDSGSTETPTSTAEVDGEDPTDAEATATAEATESPNVGSVLSAPETVISGGAATIAVEGAEASDLIASDGAFTDTEGTGIVDVQDGPIGWRAPFVEVDTVVTIQLLESQTGEEVDTIEITVRPVAHPDEGRYAGIRS
jgi:hypothetical protein